MIAVLIGIVLIQFIVIGWLLFFRNRQLLSKQKKVNTTPQKVGEFYNQNTDKFLQVYGEIIQAFRTKNVQDYLDYTIQSAQLTNGLKVIDAGCGVCGPASYFAQQLPGIKIDSCTVSTVQAQIAKEKLRSKGINQVTVTVGDYHQLDKFYSPNSFDRVLFLESFGHSNNKKQAIQAAWNVLKPGGKLYIKDLFVREVENEWEQLRINQICEDINQGYEYEIGLLNEVLSFIRKQGFIINFIRTPQVEISLFEHLTISNDFQNLFNIAKINTWEDYIFPIDFLEILVEKPAFNTEEAKHLYFMNKGTS